MGRILSCGSLTPFVEALIDCIAFPYALSVVHSYIKRTHFLCGGYNCPSLIMAGQPVPVPVKQNPEDTILCIDDLKKSAVKKLPKGISGEIRCWIFYCLLLQSSS